MFSDIFLVISTFTVVFIYAVMITDTSYSSKAKVSCFASAPILEALRTLGTTITEVTPISYIEVGVIQKTQDMKQPVAKTKAGYEGMQTLEPGSSASSGSGSLGVNDKSSNNLVISVIRVSSATCLVPSEMSLTPNETYGMVSADLDFTTALGLELGLADARGIDEGRAGPTGSRDCTSYGTVTGLVAVAGCRDDLSADLPLLLANRCLRRGLLLPRARCCPGLARHSPIRLSFPT